MLFVYTLFATQERKVISLGVWDQRQSNLMSHLWVTWSITAVWTWLQARTSESEKLISVNSPGAGDGTSKVKVTDFPIPQSRPFISRPSTSEVPCWMTHSWLHLCLKKYWVEIALTLAPVPQWSHSSSWSIMMRFCRNYNLQQIFSYFFQKKKNGLLSSLYFKFHLQVNITFSPIYFYFMTMTDENRSQCFNCSNKMNHLSCAFYSVLRFFSQVCKCISESS